MMPFTQPRVILGFVTTVSFPTIKGEGVLHYWSLTTRVSASTSLFCSESCCSEQCDKVSFLRVRARVYILWYAYFLKTNQNWTWSLPQDMFVWVDPPCCLIWAATMKMHFSLTLVMISWRIEFYPIPCWKALPWRYVQCCQLQPLQATLVKDSNVRECCVDVW